MSIAKSKLMACLLAFLVLFGVIFTVAPSTAYAAEDRLNYDTTGVLDDLLSSTVDGEKFDLKDYPYDESKDPELISFVEYSYSYRVNKRGNYGLYVYIYTPSGVPFSVTGRGNKIQMAVSYNSAGEPNGYDKFDLQFLSSSQNSDYKNLFYKFKVIDREINGTYFLDRVNSNERRYDISGIELVYQGADNAVEYPVNGSYFSRDMPKASALMRVQIAL